MSTFLAIGMDPGRSTGLAAVVLGADGPELVAAHAIYGSSYQRWWARATSAVEDVVGLAERPLNAPVTAYVEAIPPTFREASMPGVKRGHMAWAGLGEARGLGVAALLVGGVKVESIAQRDWTATLGRVAPKKNAQDPLLRVREAGSLIRGARQALTEIGTGSKAARDRSIDVAEAALIALAGCVLLRQKLIGRRR